MIQRPLTAVPLYPRHLSTSPGRIHDGKQDGVVFGLGGKGRVEGCKIWGNKLTNVGFQNNGAPAVVKGCECADAWAVPWLSFCYVRRASSPQATPQPLPSVPSLPPAANHRSAGFMMEKAWVSYFS